MRSWEELITNKENRESVLEFEDLYKNSSNNARTWEELKKQNPLEVLENLHKNMPEMPDISAMLSSNYTKVTPVKILMDNDVSSENPARVVDLVRSENFSNRSTMIDNVSSMLSNNNNTSNVSTITSNNPNSQNLIESRNQSIVENNQNLLSETSKQYIEKQIPAQTKQQVSQQVNQQPIIEQEMQTSAEEQVSQQTVQENMEPINALNIKLPTYVHIRPTNYNSIINDAIHNAMQNHRQLVTPEVIHDLQAPEFPDTLLHRRSLLETNNTLVEENTLNETCNSAQNSVILDEILPLSEDAQNSLATLDILIDDAKKRDVEYTKISDAGQHIADTGRKIVEAMQNLEWWHNKGFWASIFTLASGTLAYLFYSGKLERFFDKTSGVVNDIKPTNTFSPSNPITINNTGSDNQLLSSILSALGTAAVGITALVRQNGTKIVQIVRNVRR